MKCDNFLVYDGKNWCWIHGEGRREPRILFYFRIPEKLAHSRGGIVLYRWNYFARKRKQDRGWFVFPDPVVQSSLRGRKDVKKDGDGAADERPAKRART